MAQLPEPTWAVSVAVSCVFALQALLYHARPAFGQDQREVRAKALIEAAAVRHAETRKAHPLIEGLFRSLPGALMAVNYCADDETRAETTALIVSSIEHAREGGIADAVFLNILLEITPPHVVVAAVVPHAGPDGRLAGLLQDADNPVRKHIEGQAPQGPAGAPDFRHYAAYLFSQSPQEPAAVLVEHMFRSDPGQALKVFMDLELLMKHPLARMDKALPSGISPLKRLLYMEHVVGDVLWHERHGIRIEPMRAEAARAELAKGAAHAMWWARLYVAEILVQHPEFQTPELVERLKADKHELVRLAITRPEREGQ
ncbi:MAG: hypothetical protein KY476_06020 [Planctomycetes bacterium]|nr:hypothetical protein [Planctomycetota bacterium]